MRVRPAERPRTYEMIARRMSHEPLAQCMHQCTASTCAASSRTGRRPAVQQAPQTAVLRADSPCAAEGDSLPGSRIHNCKALHGGAGQGWAAGRSPSSVCSELPWKCRLEMLGVMYWTAEVLSDSRHAMSLLPADSWPSVMHFMNLHFVKHTCLLIGKRRTSINRSGSELALMK